VLVAIRDSETRVLFCGYSPAAFKLFVFTVSACLAGVAGALYVGQVVSSPRPGSVCCPPSR
jgi:urea transport system permease protein